VLSVHRGRDLLCLLYFLSENLIILLLVLVRVVPCLLVPVVVTPSHHFLRRLVVPITSVQVQVVRISEPVNRVSRPLLDWSIALVLYMPIVSLGKGSVSLLL
jgi:hypothetical protein